jgi:hypothetical protein
MQAPCFKSRSASTSLHAAGWRQAIHKSFERLISSALREEFAPMRPGRRAQQGKERQILKFKKEEGTGAVEKRTARLPSHRTLLTRQAMPRSHTSLLAQPTPRLSLLPAHGSRAVNRSSPLSCTPQLSSALSSPLLSSCGWILVLGVS